jgi:tRNA threonylcarbamoyladenosine biosynthesis protein TsaE
MVHDITTIADLESFAAAELKKLESAPQGATVLGLVGDLGAGKTTFTQVLARGLGVVDVVTSPTFLVMRSYPTTHPVFESLVHVDAYRIEDQSELVPLRFQDILTSTKTLVVIEWADRITVSLPATTHWYRFTLAPDGTRTVVVNA